MSDLYQGHSAEYWYREAQAAKLRVQQLDELATQLQCQLDLANSIRSENNSTSASPYQEIELELHSARQEVASLKKTLRLKSRLTEDYRASIDKYSKEIERLSAELANQRHSVFLELTQGLINPKTGIEFKSIEEWRQWKESVTSEVQSRTSKSSTLEEHSYTPPPHHLHAVPSIPQNAVKTQPNKRTAQSKPSIRQKKLVWKLEIGGLLISILFLVIALSFRSSSSVKKPSPSPVDSVYWGNYGTIYHATADCGAISYLQNNTINDRQLCSGTLDQALSSGHTVACSRCFSTAERDTLRSAQPTLRPTAKPYATGRPQSTAKPSTGSWGSDNTTTEITGSLSQTAYWTKSGKSYHFKTSCPSLSRSTNIYSGTLQDALDAGKRDPCDHCAH